MQTLYILKGITKTQIHFHFKTDLSNLLVLNFKSQLNTKYQESIKTPYKQK
ncbi:hypothetical protein B4079_3956 [Bacillus cereus]|nr:hypothetical protein B4079_3956 [Bacillus cereus]KZD26405.1 hypothetical protein B4081_5595 [Bacillus cereus]